MENKKNFYINGKWVTPKSKEEIKVIDPATEENCAVITLGNKDDVNDAVNAAKKAYSTWAFSSKDERIRLREQQQNQTKYQDKHNVNEELTSRLESFEVKQTKEN